MCDYSLESRASRPAVVGEKLITTHFGTGTKGFSSADDNPACMSDLTAVCLLPGTELAFDAPVEVDAHYRHVLNPDGFCTETVYVNNQVIEHRVARFAKINKAAAFMHHDGLEFPDQVGVEPVLLTHLKVGQSATVIQMPVDEEAARREDEATRAQTPELVD